MIKINNLNKYFNKGKSNQIHVINNTSLTLPQTGLVSLLGDSGAGKTTLLNVIGGLDRFESGEISYDDVVFKKYNMSAIDKFRGEHIGYIFQQYNLLTNYTVYENLSIQLDILGITDKEEQDKRIKYALNAVKLYKFRKKLAGQLSGGQMQRVAIARALVKKTKILIADEPTGNLDSKNSVEIMNILKNISKIALVLLVTHDKTLAEYYSDTIVELKDGQIKNIRSITNASSKDIKNRLDYKIYLGDMNKQVVGENIKTVVYSAEVNPNISLTLVEINGTYYIKSNVTIRNINETNIEVVDGSFEENQDNQIEDNFEFDNSWYNDTKKYNPIKSFGKDLIEAHRSFKHTTRRSRHISLRAILVFIGLLLSIAVTRFYNAKRIDTSDIPSDSYAYEYSYNGNDLFEDIYAEHNVSYGVKKTVSFNYFKSYYSSSSCVMTTYYFNYNSISSKGLFLGNAPQNDNQIVIGKNLAKTLITKLGLDDYEQLLNCIVNSGYSICGISNIDTDSIYRYSYSYLSAYSGNVSKSGATIPCGCYKEEKYEVLYGENLNSESNSTDVLYVATEDEYTNYKNNKTETITIGEEIDSYTIRGVVAFIDEDGNHIKNSLGKNVILYNAIESIPNKYEEMNIIYSYSEISKNTKIIGELEFSKRDSSYAPIYAYYGHYTLGQIIGNYQVVAIFKFNPNYGYSESYNQYYGFAAESYAYSCGTNRCTYIEVYDNETLDEINNQGYDFTKNAYQVEYNQLKETKESQNRSSYISIAILITICIVYTYFTMRSRMISEIYEIGVFRNIGAPRSRIVKKYVAYSIVSTLRSSFIGYVIGILGIGLFLQVVFNTFMNQEYYLLLSPYPYLGILLLFLITTIFGTLPIFTLLRKTPSEISAKYDI